MKSTRPPDATGSSNPKIERAAEMNRSDSCTVGCNGNARSSDSSLGNYNLLVARVSGWYDHVKETVFVDSIAVSQSPAKSAACRSNNISFVFERMARRWISGFDE
jgi:hypothetical protein